MGIIIDVPDDIWKAAQKRFKQKKPISELRVLMEQCLWDEFRRKHAWANGHAASSANSANSASSPTPPDEWDDNALDAEVQNLLTQEPAFVLKPPPPPRAPAPPSEPTHLSYWSTEEQVVADLPYAMRIFLKSFHLFWKAEWLGKIPERTLNEVEDFLETNLDRDFEDFSPPMRGLLAYIRIAHRNWYKATQR